MSTVKKSQARIVWAWAVRNCCQLGPVRRGAGSTPARCRIFQTVLAAMGYPRRASSPCTRRCPQVGFSAARRPTSKRSSRSIGGRPGRVCGLNRPGFLGGSETWKGRSHASAEEVLG